MTSRAFRQILSLLFFGMTGTILYLIATAETSQIQICQTYTRPDLAGYTFGAILCGAIAAALAIDWEI